MNKSQQEALDDINSIIREMRFNASPEQHAVATNTIDNRGSATTMACVVILIISLMLMGYEFSRQNEEIRTLRDTMRDQDAWVKVYGNDISMIKAQMVEKQK